MPSESDILSALTAYREHISTVNYRAMKAIIPQIEAADMEDLDLWSYPEEEEESRLEFVYGLFGLAGASDTNPPIKRASDILEHWDVLAPQLALDGAALHFDPAWRATQRKAYLAAVMEGLGRIEPRLVSSPRPLRNADILAGLGRVRVVHSRGGVDEEMCDWGEDPRVDCV
ncbi:hypothetical protein GL218_04302 [Daldinia childiae]|uniref:uncharacterized protein n=1 Tax=Daldinia childiae TaxID=326645 RepID=UPI0014469519|nr:uncharacterized protein GL218_04302 [Daldinia childiae]KAF3061328.1 hypothetical protein GL218_04302 [Daldinia childiae]